MVWGALPEYILDSAESLCVTNPEPNFIRERNTKQAVEKQEQQHPKSLIDESQRLDDAQKAEVNKRLLQSGGILRDYDNGELLYPMNLPVLSIIENMIKEARGDL